MPSLFILLMCVVVAIGSAMLSYFMGAASARWATRLGAIDQPTGGRKIHLAPIPLLGGVGIAVTILFSLAIVATEGILFEAGLSSRQLLGYVCGVCILMIGGLVDDAKSLSPRKQIIFPVLAALAVLISGTGIVQVTNISGAGGLSLVWWNVAAIHLSLPADFLTIFWLLLATYSTKLLDGLDGLVTGLAVIGAGIVGALTLSTKYYQPSVSILASSIGGSFLGFLPRNMNPARQFLGEAGSTLAGFSLGYLSIVSSSKIAIGLIVLAIPLADAAWVVIGRLRRGVSPWKGDDTHLHFRLLQAGLPQRTVVFLLWGVSFAAGVIALSLQTRGKIFLVAALMLIALGTSWFASRIASKTAASKS